MRPIVLEPLPKRFPSRRIGDVERLDPARTAGSFDVSKRLCGAGQIDVADGHTIAVAGETLAEGSPQAARGSGDDRGAA